MAGFFSKLFGGGEKAPPKPEAEALHEGYTITATPMSDGGQYRLHGTISKGEQSHTLIRADLFTDKAQCADATIAKAKQVIAEQGDRMFG
ncbi:MAG: HlyU family transcriptional regulator [Pseudomonadota bacterium]